MTAEVNDVNDVNCQTVFEHPDYVAEHNELNDAVQDNCVAMKNRLVERRDRLQKLTSKARRRSSRSIESSIVE